MKTIAFFNPRRSVGKTWLVYHLAWMFADRGLKVVVVDLDPQAKLSCFFLNDERLLELWPEGEHPKSFLGAAQPIIADAADGVPPYVEEIADNLGLVVGDLGLAVFEDKLLRADDHNQLVTVFSHVIAHAGRGREADVILLDAGSNLSAVTRAAVMAAEFVVAPLMPDVFALQSLQMVGEALHRWREEWARLCADRPDSNAGLARNRMQPIGYMIQLPAMRLDLPMSAYAPAMAGIPRLYRASVLGEAAENVPAVATDPHALPVLRHYVGLRDMALEAHKPMFFLTPADGAIGSHAVLRVDCYRDYKALAMKIAERCEIKFPY